MSQKRKKRYTQALHINITPDQKKLIEETYILFQQNNAFEKKKIKMKSEFIREMFFKLMLNLNTNLTNKLK